jgi:hypothetical protein
VPSPEACKWHDCGDPEPRRRILDFLARIGIDITVRPVRADSILPGMTVCCGQIMIDPGFAHWPGDLLHEAGHIALTDPAARGLAEAVSDDPGEEMGAIAWSYAAAVHLGIDAAVLFHAEGYRGGSSSLAANFAEGRYFGVPMLALYGMTAEPHRATERGIPAYPEMQRWLR